MKKYSTLLVGLMLCLPFFGQKKGDVKLILKNGSEITGQRIEDGEMVKMKTRDGNIFAFPKEEVMEVITNPQRALKSGGFHQVALGALDADQTLDFTFNTVTGYQIKSKLYLGVGIGVERFYHKKYIPITLETQYHPFAKWRTNPYVVVSAGKLMLHKDERGGLTASAALGISQSLGDKVALITTFGYRYAQIERMQYCYYCGFQEFSPEPYREFSINRLEFKIGIMIK